MSFAEEESALAIADCRKHGILDSSRLLHRRCIRGRKWKEEWEWCRIQPCNMLGPLNYRPYLDKDWYASGGSEVVALGTTFCHTNHFMPTVSDE